MSPAPDHGDDEMHELNQEADYLDQTITIDHNGVNGSHKPVEPASGSDPDAQAQVIQSLRTQVQDLFSQVSQLNNKLVRSYDRVSDLEDELHVTSANLRNTTIKVSQLELERTQHLSALSTGLLVERSHVTTELTRLMEKATEEAAKAGEAVSARVAIEKDLDDLSANLFHQANTMVAEARFARAMSERKVEETEKALRGAEEIVGILQAQMQALQSEKEQANMRAEEMRALMGKGKWVDRAPSQGSISIVRLLNVHTPYTEFMAFIAHLRNLRPTTQHPPAMSTLLPLPFLARLLAEDSDPTVRLDLAPSLNWLTRRSVLSAIHGGQLNVEPMTTSTLLEELSSHSVPGHVQSANIACALCGSHILDGHSSSARSSSFPPSPTRVGSFGKAAWSSSFLKTSLAQTISAAPFGTTTPQSTSSPASSEPPSQIYIFRLETTASSGLPVSLPITSQQQGAAARTATIYPLCTSGWCLTRLRTTCSLWAFIRISVVEKIWEEESLAPPPHTDALHARSTPDLTSPGSADARMLAKKGRIGIGALWGTMSRSLSNTSRPEQEKPKEGGSIAIAEETSKDLPQTPPPVPPRRLPPPPPRHPPLDAPVSAPPSSSPVRAPVPVPGPPPPLPKRNRQRTASPPPAIDVPADILPVPTPEDTQEQFTTPVEEMSPPTLRPMTPSSIPLPPSAPGTPVHAPRGADLSRVATPPPLRLSDEGSRPVPSPLSVPPPLPRRAAARARPSSLSVNVPISAPEPEAVPAEPENKLKEEPELAEDSKSAQEDSNGDPPVHSEEPDTNTAVVASSELDNDVHPTKSQESLQLAEQQSLTGKISPSQEEATAAGAVHIAHPEEEGSEVVHLETVNEDINAEVEDGSYVGNSTWEERTWRDLIKLREDMFWARVGGVR